MVLPHATRSALVPLVGLLLAAAACGSGKESAGDGGGQGGKAGQGGKTGQGGGGGQSGLPTVRDFCRELRKVDVANTKKCLGVATSLAEAIGNVDVCTAWDTAVTAGHIAYDPTRAAACLTTYASNPCAGGSLDACVGVVSGTVAAGAACQLARSFFIFSECAGDAQCVAGPAVTCAGTCVVHAKMGEACSNTQPCARDLSCDARTSRCAPFAKAGESCGLSSIMFCAAGLFCTDILQGGTCMAQHATGACRYAGECIQPAQCPTGGGVCAVPPEVGDACDTAASGCGENLVCGSDHRCRGYPLPGESCAGSPGVCNFAQCVAGTCATSEPGESCGSGANAQCGPNALCIYDVAAGQRRCTSRCL